MSTAAKKYILATLVLAITFPAIAGRVSAGSSRGGTFLPLGWDARGDGLAGAATLLSRSDGAAYWNPANLVFLLSPRATLGTTKPVPGMDDRYSILSVGTGLMDTRISKDGDVRMKRFAVALGISHLGLKLAGGSNWSESSAAFSAAFSPNYFNSFGISWKLLKSWTDLDDADAWGTAIDIGWTARLRKNVWLALVGRNFSSTIHYPDIDEKIEPAIIMALSVEDIFDRISVEGDAVMKDGELDRILIGTEIVIARDILYALCGVEMRQVEGARNIPHFGVVARYSDADIALSFAFDPEDAFGRQTRVSIGYNF